MPRITSLLTYADCIDLLIEFANGQGGSAHIPVVKRAIESAYDDIAMAHEWSFLERNGRVAINARQTTGSISYTHTGGSSERLCTLVTGTCPSWIDDAAVRLGSNDVVCDVEDGTSGASTFTLDAMMNPGEDVAAGSDYVLYQRYVRLPSDFRRFVVPMAEKQWRLGVELSLAELFAFDMYDSSTDQIRYFAVAEVPDLYDQKALFVWPQPKNTETISFAYVRWPRVLRYSGYDVSVDSAGTITATAGSSAVVGSSTAFDDSMVGAILRIGTAATPRPTGRYGESPYGEERAIVAVTDTTHLTLDANVATTRSAVAYTITDPIDVGRVAKNAFLRRAEFYVLAGLQIQNDRGQKTALLRDAERLADRALIEAMGADNSTYYSPVKDRPFTGEIPYTIGDDN